jgi:CHAT domain-containing protein/tetratricopeptide (TPR) repeat protein
VSLCLLALSLTLANSVPALSQSPGQPGPTEVTRLAGALAAASSEEDQDRLLDQHRNLVNPSLLTALKEVGHPLFQKGDYARAAKVAQIAVRIAERIGDKPGLGVALRDLGSAYTRQNRGPQALDSLQKSLTIFETAGDRKEQARSLYAIGYLHSMQRRFEPALEYYNKSLSLSEETGDRNLTAQIFSSMGLAHSALGHYDVGLELYQKSRALSEELNDRVQLSTALNNISNYYTSHGRYADALDYLFRSIKIVEDMGSAGDRRGLAIRLLNIGLIYRRQGRYDQAFAYASKSLKIFEEIGDEFGVANLENNIGVIYKAQGEHDEALVWFQKCLKRFEKLDAAVGVARALNNIGDIHRLKGQYDRAQAPLQESLRLRRQINDHGGVMLTLNNFALLYHDLGKYAEMLDVSREAATTADRIHSREDLWAAQERMGTAFMALGRPGEARQSYLASIDTLESLRREVAGGEQQQQSFLENKLAPWHGMIALLVAEQKPAEALTFAEQSKARVLLDALQPGRARLRESLSPQEKQAESEQRFQLASLNTQLSSELRRDKPDPSRVTELKASIEKARLEHEAFETRLYAARPELRLKRGEAPIIRENQLAELLKDAGSALLEYVVADDKTYLFTVTKRDAGGPANVQVYTLPIKRQDLTAKTEAFRRQLAGRDLAFRGSASSLYKLLLKPAAAQLRGKTNLVIAADDTLWDLPFQALLTGADRFLLEDVAISYAPSLTVLREMATRGKKQLPGSAPTTLLALGNPLLGTEAIKRATLTLRDRRLDPLPEAEQEVRALRRLYGMSRSRIYIGAEAREDRVKSEAGQARILHFATHGVLNNASPMYSHLALAQGSANEDGLLEAWELMQLELKAELAVLSACETARGRIGAGEGMIGLSWAMFIAGVPATVVSQWKVESAATRDLMVNFHRALISPPVAGRPRPTKTEALRDAALKLMKVPATRHPFYWGGFVLVGRE